FEPWLAIAHMNDREKSGQVFLAAPLNPIDLKPFLKDVEVIKWDHKDAMIIAVIETRIGSIVLKKKEINEINEDKRIEILVEVLKKDGNHLLNIDEATEQLINRVITIQKWYPLESWPNFNIEYLLLHNKQWLSPYLKEIRDASDLKKLNIAE